MSTVILIGTQWGDEGKGKVIDLLADGFLHVVRPQGGNNAGHTILVGEREVKLHLVPSGILHAHTQCYLGSGMVIDPNVLLQELKQLQEAGVSIEGRLWISPAAHLILPYHLMQDRLLEKAKGANAVGTTGRGIGPSYADKVHRTGIRLGDLLRPDYLRHQLQLALSIKQRELDALGADAQFALEELLDYCQQAAHELGRYITDIESRLQKALEKGEPLLLEGAQGVLLDTTLGTYPYVTSSSTTAAGLCASVGIGPKSVKEIIGVVKAYATRVGEGPFITEMSQEELAQVDHAKWREFGTTTGRKRRIGWLDAVALKSVVQSNSIDTLAITKLDLLDSWDSIKLCVAYRKGDQYLEYLPVYWDTKGWEPVYRHFPGWKEETRAIRSYDNLPQAAKEYLHAIGQFCGASIKLVSVGPERSQTIRVNA